MWMKEAMVDKGENGQDGSLRQTVGKVLLLD